SNIEKDTEEDFPVFKKAHSNESQEFNNQLKNFIYLTEKKKNILQDYSNIVQKDVANIIGSQEFFNDVEYLSQIIYSAKEAITAVDSKSTTLADVYIKLVQL
ncbi:13159_t:CDS:2, partial [Racocetra fulgida]